MRGPLARRPALGVLWAGQLLSALGDSLHHIALLWIAVDAVGAEAGSVAAAGTAARLVFGLPGGAYADRWDRRRLLVGTDLLGALAVATLAVAALHGPLSLWHLAAVAFVLGALDSFFTPALHASIPAVAGDPETLARANALLNVNPRLALILGPALAGVLLARVSIETFFALDAASFLASAAAIALAARGAAWRRSTPAAATSLRRDLATGVAIARREPAIRWALGLYVIWNVTYAVAFVVGLPLLARDRFGAGADTYGALMAGYGVGNVASTVFVGTRRVRRRARLLFAGGIVFAAGTLALAVAPSVELAMLAAGAAAIGGPMSDLMFLLIAQTRAPAEHLAKILALRFTISRASYGVGLVATAPLYAVLGPAAAMAWVGALGGLASALALVRFWNVGAADAAM